MIIEIRGVGFVNKGAELMLYAVMDKVSHNLESVQFVMKPGNKGDDYLQRAKLGLYQKFDRLEFKKYGFIYGIPGEYVPKNIREKYGLVVDSGVDIVLDASGFGHGDQIGVKGSKELAKKLLKWKRQGKKVVLLPQAFGPFEGKEIKKYFMTIVENADMVFAREKESYEHITKLTGYLPHVKIAPDFTNMLEGEVPDYFENTNYQACLIPNFKMINKTDPDIGDRYVDFMVNCFKLIEEKGIEPFVLIHDGKDYDLALDIQKQVKKEITILKETDPLYIKGIIGRSYLVVSSRFHGLVSALSQSVPALATGWSHKYQMLFEDYGCPELVIPTTATKNEIMKKIDLITKSETRSKIISTLEEKSLNQKVLVSQMWDDVINLIVNR